MTHRILSRIGFFFAALVFVSPVVLFFLWMLSLSLKFEIDNAAYPPVFIPEHFAWLNYVKVFAENNFFRYFWNSLLVTGTATLLALLIGVPAGYGIARLKAQKSAIVIMIARMTPGLSFLIPMFLLFQWMNLIGTLWPQIIIHLVVTVPLVVWIMMGYFETTPIELEEAASIDGATSWQVFRMVALPIAKPGIVVSFILSIIFSWNNFVFGVVLANRETRTLPVAVYNMLSFEQVSWGPLAAAALIVTLPVLILTMFAQKEIVAGLTAGAVKGGLTNEPIEKTKGAALHESRPPSATGKRKFGMASVKIVNAKKNFGAVKVIHGVDIDIADGEFVVLVGPSGCGKSTLLRMIAGLEEVSGGEIYIGEREVSHLRARDRDIAMVFQNYALYPHMTVFDNMGFALKLKKAGEQEMNDKVARAASILGLENLLERLPRQLSGGQRQRVAMGRAIVRDPQVFLFDEPLSNLDAKLRVQMRGEIRALHRRIGTTTIYVTHDQVEAMTMADKIVVLHDGLVEQIGTPLELYDRPDNLFVAGFIGSPAMNFIDGRIENGQFKAIGGLALPLPEGFPAGKFAGVELVYGIRPEHIRAKPDGIEGTVDFVEGTGSEVYAKLDCQGQAVYCLFRERIQIEYQQSLGIGLDPSLVHIFDKSTSRRVVV